MGEVPDVLHLILEYSDHSEVGFKAVTPVQSAAG